VTVSRPREPPDTLGHLCPASSFQAHPGLTTDSPRKSKMSHRFHLLVRLFAFIDRSARYQANGHTEPSFVPCDRFYQLANNPNMQLPGLVHDAFCLRITTALNHKMRLSIQLSSCWACCFKTTSLSNASSCCHDLWVYDIMRIWQRFSHKDGRMKWFLSRDGTLSTEFGFVDGRRSHRSSVLFSLSSSLGIVANTFRVRPVLG
jgi:hypothetical protein